MHNNLSKKWLREKKIDCSTNLKPFYSRTLLLNSPETGKGRMIILIISAVSHVNRTERKNYGCTSHLSKNGQLSLLLAFHCKQEKIKYVSYVTDFNDLKCCMFSKIKSKVVLCIS